MTKKLKRAVKRHKPIVKKKMHGSVRKLIRRRKAA